MLRDKLKDQEHFENYLKANQEELAEFKVIVDKVIEEKGVDDEGANNGEAIIQNCCLAIIKTLYSLGLQKPDI